jgi:hypothetical protein
MDQKKAAVKKEGMLVSSTPPVVTAHDVATSAQEYRDSSTNIVIQCPGHLC